MNLIKTVPEAQGLFRYNPPCCNPRATIGNFLFSFLHFRQKVSEKDAFFFCYAARLLSIFIFKTSLVFSIISFGKVILQK